MSVYEINCSECGFDGIIVLPDFEAGTTPEDLHCPNCNAVSHSTIRFIRKFSAAARLPRRNQLAVSTRHQRRIRKLKLLYPKAFY